MTETAAQRARDTLIKIIYVKLHSWLVNCINSGINTKGCQRFIGVLDMPGFGTRYIYYDKKTFDIYQLFLILFRMFQREFV